MSALVDFVRTRLASGISAAKWAIAIFSQGIKISKPNFAVNVENSQASKPENSRHR